MDHEQEETGFFAAVVRECPVVTQQSKLEAHRACRVVYRDVAIRRGEGTAANAVLFGAAVDLDGVTTRRVIRVCNNVLFPANSRSPIVTEEVIPVGGKVFEAEVIVGHSKPLRREVLLVRRSLAFNRPSTPARVNQFPLATVNLDCIPGMVAVERRHGFAGSKRLVAEAFTVTRYLDGFQTSMSGKTSE